jgi:hypothetical protein
MIRIDELYNHTFWPWFEQNRPGTRMFFCDPFGHTRPENLFNHGSDFIHESDYVFFHDQEPIQIHAHRDLFQDVVRRNADIQPRAQGYVIVSERGENLQALCDIYGWRSAYYFFHGWACLDWFRGYDRTFLFPAPQDRRPPRTTFMSPNRIIGGERDHRVLFIYHCERLGIMHNHLSAPATCPVEHVAIDTIASKYNNRYHDIEQVIRSAALPRLFRGEEAQQMTSCWLGNFAEAMDSMIYVPTETVYFGRRTHLTEKTFKAIALGMPFVLVAPAGSLAYLREYGFRTFDSVWDESYDQETDDFLRLERVTRLLADIDAMSWHQKEILWLHAQEIAIHNWNHFYRGGFEQRLWQELGDMLDSIQF